MDRSDEQGTEQRRNDIVKAIVALAVGLAGLWIISGFLRALVWAAVIAIAIDPLYVKAAHDGPGQRHRTLLAAIIALTIALVLLIPIAIGISQAAYEASAVIAWVANAQQNGIPVPAWVGHLPFGGDALTGWWQANLATPNGARLQLQRIDMASWLEQSRLIGAGLFHRAVIFAFTLIALFFLLRDRDTVVRQSRAAGHRLLGETSERILLQTVLSIRSTIDGLVLVGLGEGAVMALVYLALDVPHPLLMGSLTAVAAIIPFGAAAMFAVVAVMLVVQGAVMAAIAVVVVGLIVVGIADHFIRPAVIGSATQLPFLWVLIGILGGVETLGLLGLFIGPATMAVLIMLWREFVQVTPETAPDTVPD